MIDEPTGDPDRQIIKSVLKTLLPQTCRRRSASFSESGSESSENDEEEFEGVDFTKLTELLQT